MRRGFPLTLCPREPPRGFLFGRSFPVRGGAGGIGPHGGHIPVPGIAGGNGDGESYDARNARVSFCSRCHVAWSGRRGSRYHRSSNASASFSRSTSIVQVYFPKPHGRGLRPGQEAVQPQTQPAPDDRSQIIGPTRAPVHPVHPAAALPHVGQDVVVVTLGLHPQAPAPQPGVIHRDRIVRITHTSAPPWLRWDAPPIHRTNRHRPHAAM